MSLSNGKYRTAPAATIIVGGVLMLAWIVAMQTGGYVIDEQKIDPSGTLWPMMWFGGPLAGGVLLFGILWQSGRWRARTKAGTPGNPSTARSRPDASVE
ncbi:hypothetical protein ACPFL9_02705 [Paenarthrobacter sp. NyZ202]|uniref:hypothetical protein n=1 Tax=Paenarthrobacter sp. NyZ202 TaxID=3402689 RepID=UPI003CEC1AFB